MLLCSLSTITLTLADIHCLTLTVVIDSRKKRPKDATAQNQNQGNQPPEDPSNTSLFEEKSSIFGASGGSGTGGKFKSSLSGGASFKPVTLTHAQLRELEAAKEREVRGYKRVCELWGRMINGVSGSGEEDKDQEAVREWMVEAEKMVETFRETRDLFLTSRVGASVFLSVLLLGRLMMGFFYRRIRLGGCSLGLSQKIRIGKRRGTRQTRREWRRDYILRWVCVSRQFPQKPRMTDRSLGYSWKANLVLLPNYSKLSVQNFG